MLAAAEGIPHLVITYFVWRQSVGSVCAGKQLDRTLDDSVGFGLQKPATKGTPMVCAGRVLEMWRESSREEA